jgi:hypothetical protein
MKLKGYRTLIFNLLAALPVIVLELGHTLLPVLSIPEMQAVIPPKWLPWYLLAVALGNLALRKVTTTPMGRSE